jgi:hypothetical protein
MPEQIFSNHHFHFCFACILPDHSQQDRLQCCQSFPNFFFGGGLTIAFFGWASLNKNWPCGCCKNDGRSPATQHPIDGDPELAAFRDCDLRSMLWSQFSPIFADFRQFSPIFADFRRFSPIFANFRRFSSKKLAFFSKTNVMIIFVIN